MDTAMNPTTRAPAERNGYGAEYARSATFRSSGAGEKLLELAFINVTSLRDDEASRKNIVKITRR